MAPNQARNRSDSGGEPSDGARGSPNALRLTTPSGVVRKAFGAKTRRPPEAGRVRRMSLETILIIVVLVLLFGGGGWWWRSRR